MNNLIVLLMMPSTHYHSSNGNPVSTFIVLLIIFAIPLSWVIPIIVKKTCNKPRDNRFRNSHAKEQIEQLKDLASLKEKGILTEDEFIAQKKKILGRE